MRKVILISILPLLFLLKTSGQSLEEFKYLGDKYGNESYLSVSASFTTLSNPVAPFPEVHKISAFNMDAQIYHIDFKKGKLNYRWEHKLFSDLLFLAKAMIEREEGGSRSESSSISTGIIGWHSFTWNIIAKPKFCLAAGFALDDYFFGVSYRDSSGGLRTPEPQGWYFSAGPSVVTHTYLNKWLVMHTNLSYDISYAKGVNITYAERDDNYPKPHFIHCAVSLVTKIGAFAEVEYSRVLNKGNIPNETQRLDLKLGFCFVL